MYNAIYEFFEDTKEYDLDRLTAKEQELLKKIYNFLEVIEQTTKALESNEATLDNVLPTIDFILNYFEKAKAEIPCSNYLSAMYNSSQSKLNKYY